MFPHQSAAVNAGLVTDQGHLTRHMARSIHSVETNGEPLPLQNLGILAQAYKGGNTHLHGLLARGWGLRRRDYVVAKSATLQQA
jgi:hypothetical protein